MSSILGAISKGASYVMWGSAEDEKYSNTNQNGDLINNNNNNNNNNNDNSNNSNDNSNQSQNNNNNNNSNNSNNNNNNNNNDGELVASAKGELWKYSEKNENFKLLLRSVEIRVLEQLNEEYLCSFNIYKDNGDLMLREQLTNDLRFQYNKHDHSMMFTVLSGNNKVSVLQFIFLTPHDENELKWRICVKLMEYNRQETFDKMMKSNDFNSNDKDWVCNTYENEPENNDYIEDENDWRDLDEDVVMRNFASLTIDDNNDNYSNDNNDNNNNNNDNNNDIDNNDENNDLNYDQKYDNYDEDDNNNNSNNDNDDYDDYDDNQDNDRVNKWQQAANKPMNNNNNNRSKQNQINRYIANAKAFNRSYVVRETKPGQSVLGYFKHNDENELVYKGKIDLTDVNGNKFTPSKTMQFKSDRNMLMLSDQKPGIISVLNVDRGKVIEEWEGKPLDFGGVNDIAPLAKFDELTDNTQLYGLNKNSLYLMDGRINKKNKLVDSKQQTYKSKVNMCTISTSEQGYIVTGSEKGEIRLYDKVDKRAKTLLPGLGSKVKHIETSNDGKWLLCTCDNYIMLIPTVVPGTDRLGFTGRGMGKQKPKPYQLKLRACDIAKYKIRYINFTPAHFDSSNDSTFEEHWIVTSTGPYIIKWNFKKLKKSGIVNSYSIRRAQTKVMHNTFRFKYNDDMLISETDNVYAQHSKQQKK